MSIPHTRVEPLLEQLSRGPSLVVSLVRDVPPAILRRRPAPRVWSAHEHACHLAAVQPMAVERLEHMLSDPAPVITPYEPGRDDPDGSLLKVDLEEALERYTREREALVTRLRALTPEHWAITAEHGEYAVYSVFIMFRHFAFHDFLHAYRIEERLLCKDWADAHRPRL